MITYYFPEFTQVLSLHKRKALYTLRIRKLFVGLRSIALEMAPKHIEFILSIIYANAVCLGLKRDQVEIYFWSV